MQAIPRVVRHVITYYMWAIPNLSFCILFYCAVKFDFLSFGFSCLRRKGMKIVRDLVNILRMPNCSLS